jgi:transcriptional regulator with XRE-family HTH domain
MEKLRKLLEQKGIPQIQLASELGVSDASVSKWLNWGVPVPEKHYEKICKLLKCSPEIFKDQVGGAK